MISGDRIRGTVNLPLSPKGKSQVKEIGHELAKTGPPDIVFHSDLTRGRQTAEAYASPSGAKLQMRKALRPWPQGKFEGMPTETALPMILDYVKHPSRPIPGIGPFSGEEGISFDQFLSKWIEEGLIYLMELSARRPGLRIIAITHGRNIRSAEGWMKKGMPSDHSIDPSYMEPSGSKDHPGTIYHVDHQRGKMRKLGIGEFKPKGLLLGRHGLTEWNGENKEPMRKVG